MTIVRGIPGTRFHRVGTIFSRVTGLIRSGTLQAVDIPIWYPIYKAFPPKYEPLYDRKVPRIKVSTLAYQEDDERVKLHGRGQIQTIDLTAAHIDESKHFRPYELVTELEQSSENSQM